MTALAAMCLFAFGGFVFEDVHAWKWNEGRQESIPALSATLDNRTGKDWSEARFAVKVACASGGERRYEVTLRGIAPGRQGVRETAFDSIGAVEACEGAAAVEFVRGVETPEERRPAYAVIGFAMDHADGPPTYDLEGILDYRRKSDAENETYPVYWAEGGFAVTLPETPGVRWYVFRVEPGELGLSGFLLNRDPQSTGPLQRFLRFYPVPAGKAALLGVFRLYRGVTTEASVRLESAGAAEPALRAIIEERLARPLVTVPASRPKKDSPVIRAQ